MTTIKVNASAKYNVHIGKGLLENAGEIISEVIAPCKAAIISDDKVLPLYGKKVRENLEKSDFSVVEYTFKNGEESKNISTFASILEFLAENKLSRTDVIIALGGGVVGDMAGFCAATFLRGIRFVQIPTTILAACDSSVGGKTAIDLCAGKNLAGAFHQPSAVICDTDTFKTLDARQVSCGFAETIKYGVICDEKLFELLFEDDNDIENILSVCVGIKRDIVERDEKESGDRKLLNLGHTLGHAVEKHSDFSLTHGEAVAVGMAMIAKISEKLGIGAKVSEKLLRMLEKYGLPCSYDIDADTLFALSSGDKKADGTSITLVLPERIGKCILKKYTLSEYSKILKENL